MLSYLLLLSELVVCVIHNAVYDKPDFSESGYRNSSTSATGLDGRLPVSLVIPVIDWAFKELPMAFTSVAAQTRMPYETIVVAAVPIDQRRRSKDHLFLNLRSDATNCEHTLLLGEDQDGVCHLTAKALAKPGEPLYETVIRYVGKSPSLRGNFRDPKVRRRLDRLLPPLAMSIPRVPNLRIFLRVNGWRYSAASNRMFGCSLANQITQRFQYFDADDYMHPQTLAFCDQAFRKNPELQFLWFRYLDLNIGRFVRQSLRQLKYARDERCSESDKWNCLISTFEALSPVKNGQALFEQQELREWQWETSYELLWDGLPKTEFEPYDEENTKYTWYLYKDWPFRKGEHFNSFGNAHIAVDKDVLRSVPYPDIMLGEDALFAFRCLKRHYYSNYLNLQLMLYMD